MKRFKIAGAVAGGLAFSLVSLGGVASAQSADDVSIILENLPTAAEELAAGLQDTVDTLASTQSAVETSAAAGDALVASGSALVQGSEQFGALGLGFLLMNGVAQQTLAPYLGAIDDPSTAGDLVKPDDFATIAENAPSALEMLLLGGDSDFEPGLKDAAIQALQGNFIDGEGPLAPLQVGSAIGNALNAVGFSATTLAAGTSYETAALGAVLVAVLPAAAAAPYIAQAEEAAAPLFDAATPVTGPIVEALQGI